MAEVHLGRDSRLGRQVAIKMLRSDLARDPVFQARFRREAQSAAALNHPSIVAVYDTGEDLVTEAGGAQARLPYIVMEYVEGHTARELLHETGSLGLGLDRSTEITAGVLSALEYSHRAGIVHRDIKPANVMITPRGDIKVMDFGIARAIADASATMTQTQAVIGTAQYLSPEQARGETVDARSDLYSSGCLLFELLTGRPPFVGDSPVAVAYQHVREVPQPPSAFNPDVDPSLDRVVLQALAKDREDRYPDAGAFRADLLAARAGRPVSAPAVVAATAAATAATQAMPSLGEATQALGAAAAPTAASTPVPPSATRTITERPVDQPESQPRRRNRAAGYIGLALAVVAVFALAAFLAGRFFGGGDAAAQQVQVPDLLGVTSQQAKAQLDQLDLDYAEKSVPSQEPPDTVIDQSPPARTSVNPGSTVQVTVSAGPAAVDVPDVVGQTEAQARQNLQSAGLEAGEVTTEDHPTIGRGRVIRTDPAAGQSAAEGATVALVVSSGEMDLPDLRGAAYQDARKELLQAGFQVVVQRQPSDQPVDTVIDQSPGAGKVAQGTEVTLVVADPQPTPTTTTPTPTETASPTPTDGATPPAVPPITTTP
jgi:beta-lactam-binding protein with PASTA domain